MLNKKFKIYILAGSVLLTLVLLNYYYMPALDDIQRFQEQTGELELKSKKIDNEMQNLKQVENDYNKMSKQFNVLSGKTFSGSTHADITLNFQNSVLQIMEDNNIASDNYNTYGPSKEGDYFILSIKVTFTSSLGELLTMVESINNSEKIMFIKGIGINDLRNRSDMLRAQVVISTIYLQGDV